MNVPGLDNPAVWWRIECACGAAFHTQPAGDVLRVPHHDCPKRRWHCESQLTVRGVAYRCLLTAPHDERLHESPSDGLSWTDQAADPATIKPSDNRSAACHTQRHHACARSRANHGQRLDPTPLPALDCKCGCHLP